MASSLDTYSALLAAIAPRNKGGSFVLCPQDVTDLTQLTSAELVDQGFKVREAKRVADSLSKEDLAPLAESLGLSQFVVSPLALPLAQPKPSRLAREAQLAEYLRTDQRKAVLITYIHAFSPPGTPDPVGNRLVQTILTYEYPENA